MPEQTDDDRTNVNTYDIQNDDEYSSSVYWYQFYVRIQEETLAMRETTLL